MRNACKTFTQLSLALALFVACTSLARAQNRDSRLVSARAGGVNFVSGEVTLRRAARQSWQTLARTDELRSGDAVRTGANGRAEILLNPGSYLRLGENSEFELTDASLDTLRLRLTRGSALIEATMYSNDSPAKAPVISQVQGSVLEAAAHRASGFIIGIDTPQTQIMIVRSGIYRVNADTGQTALYVRDGRALVGRDAIIVKDGKSATVATDGMVEVAKFDKSQKDDLDQWSKQRAAELARVNSHLATRALNTTLLSMSWNSFGWNYNPTGFWYYDRGAFAYTYVPFFICRSPYGFSYNTAAPGIAYGCNCMQGGVIHRPPPNGWHNNNGAGSITFGGGSTITSSRSGGGGGTTVGGGSTTFGNSGGGGMIAPVPVQSMPAQMPANSGGASSHRIDPPLRDQ